MEPNGNRLDDLTSEEFEQGIAEAEAIEHRQDEIQREQADRKRFDRHLVAWVESDTAPAHKAPSTRPAGARREHRARRPRRVRSKRAGSSSSDDSDGDAPGRVGPPTRRRVVVDSHYVVVRLVAA